VQVKRKKLFKEMFYKLLNSLSGGLDKLSVCE